MAENKVCPHCGSKMFVAAITRGGIVEVHAAENEGEKDTYTILKESKDKYDVEFIKCAKCHEPIKAEDLLAGVKCAECGRVASPNDLVDGLCPVCKAQKDRAELANASREDLIMMLLNAEKSSSTKSIDKKIEKAIEVENSVKTDAVVQEVPEVPDVAAEESVSEPEKKTRKRRKKKTDDTTDVDTSTEEIDESEESVEESTDVVEESVDVSESPVEESTVEAQNDVANQQDAPWPDMNGLPMNLPVEERVSESEAAPVATATNEEEPVGSFPMFENDDEPF